MNRLCRLLLLVAVVLAPQTALASDFSGMGAMLGIPVLLVASALAALALLSGGHRAKLAALILLSPVAFVGLLLSSDALSLLRFGGADDYVIITVFFLALVLLFGLLIRIGTWLE